MDASTSKKIKSWVDEVMLAAGVKKERRRIRRLVFKLRRQWELEYGHRSTEMTAKIDGAIEALDTVLKATEKSP